MDNRLLTWFFLNYKLLTFTCGFNWQKRYHIIRLTATRILFILVLKIMSVLHNDLIHEGSQRILQYKFQLFGFLN